MFKKLHENAQLPTRATKSSAGYDLYASENAFIAPGIRWIVGTGVAIDWEGVMLVDPYLPSSCLYEAQVRPRSGLALKHGVTVLNAPGTIDADYNEEVRVILINHGTQVFHIEPGNRIAQLVFSLVRVFDEVGVERTGGFGSTDV